MRGRWLLGLAVATAMGACLSACERTTSVSTSAHSATARNTPTTATPTPEPAASARLRGDGDTDVGKPSSGRFFDSDDAAIRSLDEPAHAADRRAVTALVRRYRAAATAADGARACALMFSLFAESVPEDWGRGAGPSYARGSSCAVVLTKLFRHAHRALSASFEVVAVRVRGNRGYALMGSREAPASYLLVRREHGVWKVDSLIASAVQ